MNAKIRSLGFKILIYSLFSGTFIGFFYFMKYNASSDGIDNIIRNIRNEYKGVIVDYYSGNPHIPRTHIILKTKDNSKFMTDSMIDIAKNSEVGDSIIKIRNENYIILKKSDGTMEKFIDLLISDETRNHTDWPKEWKGKWMDATLKRRKVFGKNTPKE